MMEGFFFEKKISLWRVRARVQARGNLGHSGRHGHRFAGYLVRRCRTHYAHALPGRHPHGTALQVSSAAQTSDSVAFLFKLMPKTPCQLAKITEW